MILLQANRISKYYGSTPVLTDVTIQIQTRERIGLVGVNGAGKSTLLRILAGESSYDQGEMFKPKETRIGYLAQNTGLDSGDTIWNEMVSVFGHLTETERELRELERRMADPELGLSGREREYEEVLARYAARSDFFRDQGGYEMETKIRGVLNGMGFAEYARDTRIHTLSGGQKTRLALAKLLLSEPDVLLLDEPTNHLDIPTLTWLEGYLRSYPGAILIVSHDRYFLDAVVGVVYEIERRASKRYVGNYSRFIEQKAAEYEQNVKLYERQQDEIARMEDFIQRNIARASSTKLAQSRRKALSRMERMDRPAGELKRAHFTFEVERTTGNDVLQVDGLAVGYPSDQTSSQAADPAQEADHRYASNSASQPPSQAADQRLAPHLLSALLSGVNFDMWRGNAVALVGPNGVGKTTLLKTVAGELEPLAGGYRWGANVALGVYDQEQRGLHPELTVLEEVWSEYRHLDEVQVRTVLGNFLFSGDDVKKKVSTLSGGEKARVSLAKLMLQKANVLLLDEPTNHLDLYSKEVLEAALLDYEGTILFISHDRYFINKIADRVIELSGDGAEQYLGNYDDYLEKKQEQAELAEIARAQEEAKAAAKAARAGASAKNGGSPALSADSAPRSSSSEDKKLERKRLRRLEQLEAEIAELESEVVELEERLTQPDVFNDYIAVQETTTLLEGRKSSLQLLYDEWAELAED